MSYPTRSISSHIRQPSMAPPSSSTGQSPALIARVNEKKAELENLKELRDLSAAVASQMEALEQKLATLSDGTEGMCRDYDKGDQIEALTEVDSNRARYGQLAQRPARNQHGFLQTAKATTRVAPDSCPNTYRTRACVTSPCGRGRWMNTYSKKNGKYSRRMTARASIASVQLADAMTHQMEL